MAIDGVSCQILAYELNESLEGARVDKIHQPARYTISLQFRSGRSNLRLALIADPSGPTVYPLADAPPNPQTPPSFCMFLRKHLQGATVISIKSPEFERILDFHFSTTSELGDRDERHLIIELMGRHSNIVVTNRNGIILESLVHVDEAMSRVREVMPARPYVRPPAQNKLIPQEALEVLSEDIVGVSTEDANWMIRFREAAESKNPSARVIQPADKVKNKPQTVKNILLQSLQGFSPQLCEQVIAAARLNKLTLWDQTAEDTEGRFRLKQALTLLLTDIRNSEASPCLLFREAGDLLPIDCHAFLLDGLGETVPQESYLAALKNFHSNKVLLDQFKQKQRALETQVDHRLQRSLRRAENLRADLTESQGADMFRRYGELLLGSLYMLEGKHAQAEVIDYYDPEQSKVIIPMDQRFDAQTNAQRYFKKATRLQTAAAVLVPELRAEEANTAYLRDLLNLVQTAESSRELDDLRVEVEESPLFSIHRRKPGDRRSASSSDSPQMPAGRPAKSPRSSREAQYMARQKDLSRQRKGGQKQQGNVKGASTQQALPPRQYKTSNGLTVLAGRSNLQNDQLTMRTAAKTDLWFHVQRDAGTHVILRTEGRPMDNVPDQSILEAASIAAWFSRGNKSMQEALQVAVPVDYCPVSHVRKPRGAKPGFVIYDNYKTAQVKAFDPEGLRETD